MFQPELVQHLGVNNIGMYANIANMDSLGVK